MEFKTVTQLKQANKGTLPAKAVVPATPKTTSFPTVSQLKSAKQPTTSATPFPTVTQLKTPTQPVEQPEQKDLATQVYEAFPQTMQTLSELQIDPLSLKADPKKAIGNAWNALKGSVVEEGQRIKDYLDEYKQKPTNLSPVGKTLKMATGVANVVFSPLSALFAGAKDIPVLGSIARLIELPFSAVGEGATHISDYIVDELPISQEAKDNIKPGMGEVFALAGQIALGKVVEIGGKKYGELTKKYGVEDATTIVNKANELAKTAPKEQLPQKTATTPPESPIVSGENRGVSIKPQNAEKVVEVPREQLPVGGGAEKVSRLEARVKGVLDTAPPDVVERLGLSTYESMKKPEQIKMATEYVLKSQDEAMKVLSGEIEAPPGILKNSIYVAMDKLAGKDIDLATKLATLESTRMGQELSILTELDPNSPVKLMRDIIDVREKAFQEKTGKTTIKAREEVVKSVKEAVKKNRPKATDWVDFVRSIECGG
jgi:hypothetical protein